MIGIEWQMIIPTFFRYLSGKNWAKLATPCTYRSVIPKRNGLLLYQCAH